MKKKKRGRWILLGVAAAAAAGLAALSALRGPKVPVLTAHEASRQPLESYIYTSGTVSSGELLEYAVSGRTVVARVSVQAGDSVRRGDVLVTFDHTGVKNEYQKAAIAYEKVRLNLKDSERIYFETKEKIAELEYEISIAEERRESYDDSADPYDIELYERYDALYEKYTAEKESLEKSLSSDDALLIGQLGLKEAQMALDEAQQAVDNLPGDIIAGADGVIETLGVQPYRAVDKGTVAVALRSAQSAAVDFEIGRYDITRIRTGQPASVRIGNTAYSGVVGEIGTAAGSTALVKARLEVSNADAYFIPGLEADIDIRVYQSESALTLPMEAVKSSQKNYYCYVLTPEGEFYRAQKTPITIGESSDTDIEILSGLSEGQLVAANPPKEIESVAVWRIAG